MADCESDQGALTDRDSSGASVTASSGAVSVSQVGVPVLNKI